MAAYDDRSFSTQAYSTTAWDFVVNLLPDGVKAWVRRTAIICRTLSFKVET